MRVGAQTVVHENRCKQLHSHMMSPLSGAKRAALASLLHATARAIYARWRRAIPSLHAVGAVV